MTEPTVRHTPGSDPTLGALVNDLTTQVPELIRSELRLAQAEMARRASGPASASACSAAPA